MSGAAGSGLRPTPGGATGVRPGDHGAAGEYTLSELARGRYSVGPYNGKTVEIEVGRGVVQNFELGAELEISGRAVDAITGQGLAEVAPQLVALTPDGSSIDPGIYQLRRPTF